MNAGILFVYLKSHGTEYNGKQLIHCRFQLRSTKGSFFSSSEGWDVEQIFRLALHRLEIQILRSKETERRPELARDIFTTRKFPVSRTIMCVALEVMSCHPFSMQPSLIGKSEKKKSIRKIPGPAQHSVGLENNERAT